MAIKSLEALIVECVKDVDAKGADKSTKLRAILGFPPEDQLAFLLAIVKTFGAQPVGLRYDTVWSRDYVVSQIALAVLARKLPFDADTLSEVVRAFATSDGVERVAPRLVTILAKHTDLIAESVPLRKAVDALRSALATSKHGARIDALLRSLGGKEAPVMIEPGEAWSDVALADIKRLSDKRAMAWHNLLAHAALATAATPSTKWTATAQAKLKAVGEQTVREALVRWLPLVERPRTAAAKINSYQTIEQGSLSLVPRHMDVLRGLCWTTPLLEPNADLARAIGRLALTSYKKLPRIGPRAIKVGHAAVWALGHMSGRDSLAQLAMLKVKVKFIPAQKGIDKALTAAATREGLPRNEIEELAVPSYGLDDVGVQEVALGDFVVRLIVRGVGDVELQTSKRDGKILKSIPAALKSEHADELQDLRAAQKDIAAMLPAQRDRLDAMFLQQRSWPMPVWRERYLDHPLVGVLARRLIWSVQEANAKGGPSASVAVCWLDGALVDAAGVPREINEDAAVVRLWHPLEDQADAVLAWRRFFEDRGLRQPFKQAHREIYLLTDAERRTETYSNRFAAHVIRQHQFHALAAQRGWRNQLRLAVDAEYAPASRELAEWGLRAEFWIEGIGDDVNDAGAYHYLATDQVRFYPINSAQVAAHAGGGGYSMARPAPIEPEGPDRNQPVVLERIPPLVLSEILRDVDLFVGVASVGNNPNWQDGGPQHQYRDYWWTFGFGELNGTAQSRRELLGRLLPRLKIAGVCTLGDRFLIVRGKLREYAIHLGSGNILMRPDDQYLCIVPNSREAAAGDVQLPFEGDRTLSIILSKAFLLASDDTIKDASIFSQIKRSR